MDSNKSIQWYLDRTGKVFYSMIYRLGQIVGGRPNFDCSSAQYYSLIEGGYLPVGTRIGNTDTLFNDLERNGWVQLKPNAQGNYDTQRNDVALWGVRGASTGAAGHTMRYLNANDVTHCSGGYNGIHTDNYDQLRSWNDNPVQTFYRYVGGPVAQPPVLEGDTDQNVDIGSYIKFDTIFTADDVQLQDGIWQVKTNELCPKNFTWMDNGIPAGPLVEVDDDGYATADQDLNVGSKYKIPGKFTVIDLGLTDEVWMALIEADGLRFWVDINTATEVVRTDAGTPTPGKRPPSAPSTPEQPEVTPPPKSDEPEPETPEEPAEETPPEAQPEQPNESTPVETKPEEPVKDVPQMAFSAEQQKALLIHQQSVLESNADDFTPVISSKAKTIAYFTTDITAIVSTFVFTFLAVQHIMDGVQAVTLNAAVAAAMLGTKAVFKISAKK